MELIHNLNNMLHLKPWQIFVFLKSARDQTSLGTKIYFPNVFTNLRCGRRESFTQVNIQKKMSDSKDMILQ